MSTLTSFQRSARFSFAESDLDADAPDIAEEENKTHKVSKHGKNTFVNFFIMIPFFPFIDSRL